MRIRTQFVITMLIFGAILVIMAASAVITNQRMEKVGQQERIAASIAQGASELGYLANDYLIYRESQQLKRWQTRFISFSAEVAGLHTDRPEQQALIANIQANQKRLKEVFDSVAFAPGSLSLNQGAVLDAAFLQVSWSRMAVQSQGLVSDASRLSELLHQQMDQLSERRTLLMYVMVGLFGVLLLSSYMLTYRRILKSMAALQAGTVVIGTGNLEFTIEEKKKDEIGDLSRAFNRMSSDLKTVTASKGDLEREVAERKRAEERLSRQREWLEVTLTSIGDAVIATDTESKISFLNPVAAALTGWPIEEARGRPVLDLFRIINEKTREPAEDVVGRALREGVNVALANHTALVTRDGREIPIEDSAAPIRDGAGKVAGVVLVFHDVTEKRRATEALRESEAKYRTLFENMAEEVHFWQLIRDEAGRIKTWRLVDVNPPTLKIWGRTSVDEIKGKTMDEIFGPGATEHYMPVVQKIMTEGVPYFYEDYFPNLDKHFRFTSVPLKGYFITTGADITGIKKAEEALRANNEELTRLNNAMVGRELRMIELKKEVNALCARAGERPRYREDFEEEVERRS